MLTELGEEFMNETTTRLLHKFGDEEYRYAYDEEFANSRMAMQIQVIRESQDLTQQELADLADMRQSRISELENVNYSSWTVSTLRRLARSLGVRFSFGLESWGELLQEVEESGREHLVRPRFEKDPVFRRKRKHMRRLAPRPSIERVHQPYQQRLFIDSGSLLRGGGGGKDFQGSSMSGKLVGLASVNQESKPPNAQALTLSQEPREAA